MRSSKNNLKRMLHLRIILNLMHGKKNRPKTEENEGGERRRKKRQWWEMWQAKVTHVYGKTSKSGDVPGICLMPKVMLWASSLALRKASVNSWEFFKVV